MPTLIGHLNNAVITDYAPAVAELTKLSNVNVFSKTQVDCLFKSDLFCLKTRMTFNQRMNIEHTLH